MAKIDSNDKHLRAFVVGKFSPLHKGHEYLLSHALQEASEVVVFSYSRPTYLPGTPDVRRKWFQSLFPKIVHFAFDESEVPPNDAPAEVHRMFCATKYLELVGKPLDFVFSSESYGSSLAQAMTTLLQKKNVQTHDITHRCLDPHRTHIRVSGTIIRENDKRYSQFLSPVVRASFVKTICLLGAESVGKSTLAQTLAEHFQTRCVDEFGRELWEERGGELSFDDYLLIAETHLANEEEAALEAAQYLFVDTSPLTTVFYAMNQFGRVDPRLMELANRTYDFTFLCAPDFPMVQDGTRNTETFRQSQHEWYVKELERRRVSYRLLTGSLNHRISIIEEVLGA